MDIEANRKVKKQKLVGNIFLLGNRRNKRKLLMYTTTLISSIIKGTAWHLPQVKSRTSQIAEKKEDYQQKTWRGAT